MIPRKGQTYKLHSEVVAIQRVGGRTQAVILPAGNVVKVIKFPSDHDNRMADALCNGKDIVIFGLDLQYRAEELGAIAKAAS